MGMGMRLPVKYFFCLQIVQVVVSCMGVTCFGVGVCVFFGGFGEFLPPDGNGEEGRGVGCGGVWWGRDYWLYVRYISVMKNISVAEERYRELCQLKESDQSFDELLGELLIGYKRSKLFNHLNDIEANSKFVTIDRLME